MDHVTVTEEQIIALGQKLKDAHTSMAERFRILFTLRNLNTDLTVKLIGDAFLDDSVLLKHELAYCLGQMRNSTAIPILDSVLENESEDPMVRHEAGEALGAIGNPKSLEILEKYAAHPCQEIAETCQIALQKIRSEGDSPRKNEVYLSVDPASSIKEKESADPANIAELRNTLLNSEAPLYRRYEAMFTLRNIGTTDAVLALCDGLKDSTSALFRHEIAFVLGQMQQPVSAPALADCLANTKEHEMVRHECAEALGAIGTEETKNILEKYLNDEQRVVKESVLVALDICEHEQTNSFQYANGLTASCS